MWSDVDLFQATVSSMAKANTNHSTRVKEADARIKEKDEEIGKLVKALETSNAEVTKLKAELGVVNKKMEADVSELKKKSDGEISALNTRLECLKASLSEFQSKARSLKILFEKFSDPVSNVTHTCPVIQNNGVIRSLVKVIDIWLKEADLGPSNAFRMYQCPVLGGFSMIAPVQIIETFRTLAASTGVKVDLPVKFLYRQEDGSWVEFPFHEQLELIARLCSVYSHRTNQARLPEQRNVSIGDLSFMIIIRAIAHGVGFRLECNGFNNNGTGARMSIKAVFEEGWSHPFVDMDFSVDA